jgi:hypothetical protein
MRLVMGRCHGEWIQLSRSGQLECKTPMGFLGRTAAKVKDRFERSEWTAVEENPGQKLECHDAPTKVDGAGPFPR